MSASPTIDGDPAFGLACHVVHLPNANEQQISAFFGVTGNVSLFGGGRGRVFTIDGVLFGVDIPSVLAAEANLLSYADGVARIFTDTYLREWPNVIFKGEYQPYAEGIKITDQGFVLPYRCVLHSLT